MAGLFVRVSISVAALLGALASPVAAGETFRRDDGNASYNAYNSHDGHARRGYWERPGEHRWRHRHRRGCGHHGWGGDHGDHDGGLAYYPGYGYAQVVVEHGRPDGCAWRYRGHERRSDGRRHRC